MQWIVKLLAILFVSSGVAVADSSAAVPSSNISDFHCINSSDYLRIERSLLNRPQNLVNLHQAFFPTNKQASISVNVTYHFTNSNETVTYRWLDSSVLMLIRSDLLHYLSLFAYNVKTRCTDITLDPICGFSSDDPVNNPDSGPSDYCKVANSTAHHLLNNLTANLLSYAMHHKSVITNGIDSTIESGYSVYVFNSNNPSDYCIFDEVPNFLRLRILLGIAFGLLEMSSVFSIPLLLASMYERFRRKMTKQNLRYFVWATLVLIVLMIPLLITCNIFALINGFKTPPTHYNDIHTAFIMMAVAMGIFPLVDTVAAILVMYRFKRIEENLWTNINCFGFRNYTNTCLICGKNFLHGFAIVAVTWFTQLALFNSIYMFIGAIAAPVETGSLLLLYITSLFALISFFAVILKVFHKTLPEPPPAADGQQGPPPPPAADGQQGPPPATEAQERPPPAAEDQEEPPPAAEDQEEPPPAAEDQEGPPPAAEAQEGPPPAAEDQAGPPPAAEDQAGPPPAAEAQAGQGFVGFLKNNQCLIYFVLLIALVCVLAAGIGVFVSFMYIYITLNQEYRNNRGILTFLAALLPSLLVSISGIFWTRVMRCIGKDNNDAALIDL